MHVKFGQSRRRPKSHIFDRHGVYATARVAPRQVALGVPPPAIGWIYGRGGGVGRGRGVGVGLEGGAPRPVNVRTTSLPLPPV